MSQLQDNLNEILRQKNAYLLPGNLKKNISLLGVTGTLDVHSDIILYSTKEALLADTTEPENEYGVVYGPKLTPLHDGMTASAIYFLDEVVFDTAITDSYWAELEIVIGGEWYWGDIYVSPGGANFQICNTSVQYESADGLTYTVKDADASKVNTRIVLPGEVEFTSRYGKIDDVVFAFFKDDDNYFEGMYEWKNEADVEYVDTIVDMDYSGTSVEFEKSEHYVGDFKTSLENTLLDGLAAGTFDEYFEGIVVKDKTTDKIYLINPTTSNYVEIDADTGDIYMAYGGQGASILTSKPYKIEVDIENDTVGEKVYYTQSYSYRYTNNYNYEAFKIGNISNIELMYGLMCHLGSEFMLTSEGVGVLKYDDTLNILVKVNANTTGYTDWTITNNTFGPDSFLGWHHVRTEFTITSPSQLLPGHTALGKHSVITGDGSIYSHIDLDEYINNTLNDVTINRIWSDISHKGKCLKYKEELASEQDIDMWQSLMFKVIHWDRADRTDNPSFVRVSNDNLMMYVNDTYVDVYSLTTAERLLHYNVGNISSGVQLDVDDDYLYIMKPGTLPEYSFIKVNISTGQAVTETISTFNASTTNNFSARVINGDYYTGCRDANTATSPYTYKIFKNNTLLCTFSSTESSLAMLDIDNTYIYLVNTSGVNLLTVNISNSNVTSTQYRTSTNIRAIKCRNMIAVQDGNIKVYKPNNGSFDTILNTNNYTYSMYGFTPIEIDSDLYFILTSYQRITVLNNIGEIVYNHTYSTQFGINNGVIFSSHEYGYGYEDEGSYYFAPILHHILYTVSNDDTNVLVPTKTISNSDNGNMRVSHILIDNMLEMNRLTLAQENIAINTTETILGN